MRFYPNSISGRGLSRAVDYREFDEVAVLRTIHEYPVGRRLTYAEAAEVVRRMTRDGRKASAIAERLGYHRRSVWRIRARLREMGR